MTESATVELVGLASDANSSFLRGPAQAPAAIRRVMASGASNLTSESGVDLSAGFFSTGQDHAIGDESASYLAIEQILGDVLARGARPLVLGGDHAVTFPVLRAIASEHGPVNLLHFDAHADVYEVFAGNRYSHACPFARIMEERLARRLVQVGIRTLNAHQRDQVARHNIEIHEARDFDVAAFRPEFDGPLYISIDLDVFDPAFAPGVSHHEPGGLSVREVIAVIQSLRVPVVGADVVEYNPRRDINDMTAAVAVKLVKELAAIMQ